jgi:ribonuclease P/MRP protein subunit RPP40
VYTTTNVKSSRQCQEAYTKASKALGLIARTMICREKEVLMPLYKTLVRPHLEYCVVVWSLHHKKDKQLLERVQHRFTRLISGMKELAYEDGLNMLRLWSLEERRNRADLIEVFKMKEGLSAIPFENFFALSDNSRTN